MLKRILSAFLALVMVVGMLPVNAFAQETATEPVVETSVPVETTSAPVETTEAAAEKSKPAETVAPFAEEIPTEEEPPETAAASNPATASYSGTWCGVNWTLENGVLTLTGSGAMSSNSSYSTPGWYSYRDTITSAVVEEGITSLAHKTFYQHYALESVTLPEGLTYIGGLAFTDCYALKEVILPSTMTTMEHQVFSGCSVLEYVYVPSGMTAIGSGSFGGIPVGAVHYDGIISRWQEINESSCAAVCNNGTVICWGSCGDNATYVLVGDTLTISGTGAMTEFAHGNQVPWRAYRDLITYLTIEEGITNVGSYTMAYTPTLEFALIADTVTTIGSHAFYGCSELDVINVPNDVTTIGDYAFYECTGMWEANLNPNLLTVGASCFIRCTSLNAITVPASVTTLGNELFGGCTNLTVTYEGSRENWIVINEGTPLAAQCSDGSFYRGGTCGENAYWYMDSKENLFIGGTGDMTDYTTSSSSSAPWRYSAVDAVTLVVDEGVTSLGDYAFYNLTNLSDLSLPSTLTRIGNGVFSGCDALPSLDIPESVTTMGNSVFSSCDTLTTLTIPDSVTQLGSYVFKNCTNLLQVSLPASLTAIGDEVFYECKNLSLISIPASVTTIGMRAFYNCCSINTIVLPEGLTEIGTSAFANCTNLADVNIPASLTTIHNYAFQNCSSIVATYIPITVTYVGIGAVYGNITYEGTMAQWMEVSAAGRKAVCSDGTLFHWGSCGSDLQYILTGDGHMEITGSGSMASYSSYSSVPWNSFNASITSVSLPEGLTSIGNYAFYNCYNLEAVEIPGNVTSIGNYAFYYCSKLTEVTIPASVTTIGNYAFQKCGKMKTVRFLGEPPAIVSTAFTGVTADVYYPEECTGWNDSTKASYGGSLTWHQVCSEHDPMILEAVAPTCTKPGLTEGSVCAVCGDILQPQRELPALGHTEVIDPGVEASCEGNGLTEGSHCETCGEILIPQTVIPAHTFNGDVCIYCGTIGGNCGENVYWKYDPENKELILSGLGDMADFVDSASQPWAGYMTQIRKLTVEQGITTIGNYAFYNATNLTEVSLPDTVFYLGNYAFRGCSRLSAIDLPDSIISISYGVFSSCTKLETMELPRNLESLGSSAFSYSSGLKTLVFPETLTNIPNSVCENCTALETVVIPDSVTVINDWAFSNCKALKQVTIPASVTEVRHWAFAYCDALTDITFGHTSQDTLELLSNSFTLSQDTDTILRVPYVNDVHTAISGYGWAGGHRVVTWKGTVPVTATAIVVTAQDNVAQLEAGLELPFLATFEPWYTTSEAVWSVIPEGGNGVIDENGVLLGTEPGYVTVRCEASDDAGVYGECRVEILEPTADVSAIHIRCPGDIADEVEVGTQVQLIAEVQPGNAANKNVIWELENGTGEATITEEGVLTAISTGTVTVYATATDGTEVMGSQSVNIVRYVEDIQILFNGTADVAHMAVGECVVLTAAMIPEDATSQSLTWSVTDGTGSASLHSRSGFYALWGREPGTVTLTVTANDSRGLSVSREITVGETVAHGVTGGNIYFDPVSGMIVDADDTVTAANIPGRINGTAVTGIAAFAFAKHSYGSVSQNKVLTSVTIPSSVTFIGDRAFHACVSLSGLKINGENLQVIRPYAFYECLALTSLTIPDSVSYIGEYAFRTLNSLKTLKLSGQWDTTDWMDSYMPNLETVTFTGSYICSQRVEQYENGYSVQVMPGRNARNVIITDSVKEVRDYAFHDKDRIQTVTMADSVTCIGVSAFNDCDALTQVDMGDGVTYIGDRAFLYNYALSSLTLSDSLQTIGESAFAECRNLTTVTLPEGLSLIGQSAFSGCYNLVQLNLPSTLKTVGAYAFSNTDKLNLINMDALPERITARETPLNDFVDVPQVLISATGGKVDLQWELYAMEEGINPWEIAGVGWYEDKTPILFVNGCGTVRLMCWDYYTGARGEKVITLASGIEIRGAEAGYLLSGKSLNLTAWMMPGNEEVAVSWSVDKPACATITGDGRLTAKGVAQATRVTVTAIPYSDLEPASISLWIMPSGSGLEIYEGDSETPLENGSTMEVDMREVPTLTLSARMGNNEDVGDIYWSSNRESVAMVDSMGFVTLLSPGIATITAQGSYGETATLKLKITYLDAAEKLTATVDVPEIGLQPGQTALMQVSGNGVLNPAHLTFSIPELQQSIATVDESGIITAGSKPGTAVVTAAIKGDPLGRKVSVQVKVVAAQTAQLRLLPGAEAPARVELLDALGKVVAEEAFAVTARLNLSHEALLTDAYTFTITPYATDAEGNELPLDSAGLKWASSDTSIARVTANADGSATVTLQTEAMGSCVITAVTTDSAKVAQGVTVYIRDYTPRLESTTLTGNALLSEPITVGLVESYGNAITAVALYEYDADTESYVPSEKLEAAWRSNVLQLTPKEYVKNGTLKLMLQVACANGSTYEFQLSLKVKNTSPAITSKQRAKFNLFYTDSEAFLTVTAKNTVVTDVQMDETSSASFRVTGFDPETGVATIGFSEEQLYSTAKPDTKLTLLVYLEGYNQPVEKNVTISTTTTKPKLTLTPSASVINTALSGDSTTVLQVYDKTAGETLWLQERNVTVTADFATGEVTGGSLHLTLTGDAGGTAAIEVQQDNWMSPIRLTHKVTVKTELPTPKTGASTLKLNRVFSQQTASTTVTLSQANLAIGSIDFEAATASGEKIDLSYDDGIITASFPDPEDTPKAGTYSFRYTVTLTDGTQLAAKTLKVSVGSTVPKVKFSTSTLKLNRALCGYETASCKVSVATDGYQVVGFEELTEWDNDTLLLEYDEETTLLSAQLLDEEAATKKHAITLTPILFHEESGQTVTLPGTVKLTVQVYHNDKITVALSAKGKLDAIDPTSAITYTVSKISNTADRIEDVTLVGEDADLFDIETNLEAAKPTVTLRMVEGEEYTAGETYKVQLSFLISGQDVVSKVLSFRVSQSKLKLALEGKSLTYFQSQTVPLTGKVTLTAPAAAVIGEEGVTLNRDKTTKALLDAMGDGELMVLEEEDGFSFALNIAQPGYLVSGKSYTLYLDILPENSARNAKATALKITVKIRK